MFGDDGRDLAANAAGEVGLVHDEHLARAAGSLKDGAAVQRGERAQVEDRALDAGRGKLLGGLEALVHHVAVRDDGQVVALPADLGRPDWHDVIIFREIVFQGAVCLLVLEVDHGVGVADRGFQHALGVVGRRRRDDLEAGDVREQRFDRLRVVHATANPAPYGARTTMGQPQPLFER